MNDQAPDIDETTDELAELKQRADMMKLRYHPSIGLAALREKVNAALNSDGPEAEDAEEAAEEPVAAPVASKRLSPNALRKQIYDEEMKLIRVRITNMNPSKKELDGEYFCVANRYIGAVKKFVPYGELSENGFHLPNVIVKQLMERKFVQVKVKKDPANPQREIVTQRWVNEFAIEILPQLTAVELARLAAAQAAAAGLDEGGGTLE